MTAILRMHFDDALMLAPILASYGAWLRLVCPSQSVIDTRWAAINSIHAKISAMQQARRENREPALCEISFDEIDTITSALRYFMTYLPQAAIPSPERDAILRSCEKLRSSIAVAFQKTASRS